MVEGFFWRPDLYAGTTSDPGNIMLLSGPPSSGKTSLLFQFAFNSVPESNSSATAIVVFICNRRTLQQLETKPPLLSQGVDPSSHVFDRIQMKYVDGEEGLNNYFAAFHMYDTFPVSVIIDDFGDFFDQRNIQDRFNNSRGRDMAIVQTLALCRNAIAHANERGPCKLLLADTHLGDSPRLLYLYKRWVSSIFTIRGDGLGSFLLHNKIYSGSHIHESGKTKTAKYSISLQYLVLEGITEDEEH